MKNLTIILATVLLSNAIGCAKIKIINDEGTEKGLKFYYPKPYLLVEYNPAKDVAVKTSIIYLPDRNDYYYAKSRSGLGKAELKVDFQNGYMTSFGNTSDSKVSETIKSVADLAGS
ncbi:hypothetical protein [Pleomorphovibrio marinus]|uniref:hypothetical protein n=1 Tax=Pleomorphovibrio marinus TaxID=2164132 RepID=UPI000E0A8C13|nr:hypothetical protein [Pleomorphovibrio marinus]